MSITMLLRKSSESASDLVTLYTPTKRCLSSWEGLVGGGDSYVGFSQLSWVVATDCHRCPLKYLQLTFSHYELGAGVGC